jgi:hypothetical protein
MTPTCGSTQALLQCLHFAQCYTHLCLKRIQLPTLTVCLLLELSMPPQNGFKPLAA